ncbi:FimV/HubP family polar landmark protein [Pseudaeromonas paramecii]|uniref:LysM domain-containing protein n=1 Tax=Pseudaeromonas paramecii TaxID=2138166 RepID=A0ABP8PZU4_9GAMM
MGLPVSRLALAVALCLELSATVQAAQQFDEFYVEIKGPDAPAPAPSLIPKPVAQPAAVQPGRAPSTPNRTTPTASFLTTPRAAAGTYGPVRSEDTLWSISQRSVPGQGVTLYQTLMAIYRKNPQAFANGHLNSIYKGAILQLPTLEEAQAENDAAAREAVRTGRVSSALLARSTVAVAPKAQPEPQPQVAAVDQPKPQPPAEVAKQAPIEVKPEVKLTPEASTLTPAKVTEPVAATPAAEQGVEGSKIEIPSQGESTQVDAAVKAVVGAASEAVSTGTASTADQLQSQLGEYETEIAQLSENNNRLKLRVQEQDAQLADLNNQLQLQAQLQEQVAQLRSQLSELQANQPAGEPTKGFFGQLLASPVNLVLIILLPILLILALGSLWLRARAMRELQAREAELAESTALQMEQDASQYDQLLTAGMAPLEEMPDLETEDETLSPAPSLESSLDEADFALGDVDLDVDLSEETAPSVTQLDEADEDLLPLGEAPHSQVDEDELALSGLDLSLPDDDADLRDIELPDLSWRESAPQTDELDDEFVALNDGDDSLADADDLLAQLGVTEQVAEPELELPELDEEGELDLSSFDEALAKEAPLEAMPQAADSEQESSALEGEDQALAVESNFEGLDLKGLDELDLPEEAAQAEALEFEPLTRPEAPEPAAPLAASTADITLAEPAAAPLEAEWPKEMKTPSVEEESLRQLAEQFGTAPASEQAADWYSQDAEIELAPHETARLDQASEPVAPTPVKAKEPFLEIDELLAEADAQGSAEGKEIDFDLDTGLDDFPDLLSQGNDVDVDADDGGVGAKLDLARAYLEIDDKESARELLQEALAQGNAQQQAEADKLLKRLS